MEMVGRRHVDDVHGSVAQELLERGVGSRDTQGLSPVCPALRRAAEHTPDVDPDPAQCLDVDGADEPGPDHGRANAREAHPRALLQASADRTRLGVHVAVQQSRATDKRRAAPLAAP